MRIEMARSDTLVFIWMVFVTNCCHGGTGSVDQCNIENGLCSSSTKEPRLIVRPPVQVGHVEELDVDPERKLFRKTASVKPPIFEIKDFLTFEECEHLKNVAISKGLQDSETYSNAAKKKSIHVMDINRNKLLDLDEMRLTLENSFDVYFDEEETLKMYQALSIDNNNDGLISPEELSRVHLDVLKNWLSEYVSKHPKTRSRTSQQIWIFADRKTDPIIKKIQDRVTRLTGLHPGLIESADLQVVHYKAGGHYHAHYDSSDPSDNLPCCKGWSKHGGCRICRFMTVLFYLNDVEEGGGTAFPVADNKTFNVDEMRVNHLINLREHCHSANLLVAPSRGKAVMWYNHQVDPLNGWTGSVEEQSIHGGCPVSKGEKWIANFWIQTSNDKQADLNALGL